MRYTLKQGILSIVARASRIKEQSNKRVWGTMLKTVYFTIFVFIFSLATPLAGESYAQSDRQKRSPIGHVAAVEGSAFLIGKGDPLRLKADDPIYLNNTIETRDETRIAIVFVDDSQIRLGSNASLKIDKYVYDPYPDATEDNESNKAEFSVMRGAFEYLSGLLAKPFDSDVKVKTSKGSIGIRGTKFWGGPLDEAQYAVYVEEGAVEFAANDNKRAFLEAGQGLYITDISKPLPDAEKWQDFRIEKAKEKVEFFTIAREQLLKRIRIHQERNIKSRQDLWRSLHPRAPVPWDTTGGNNNFSDDMNEQQERHRQRMQQHDQRIRER